MNNIRDARSCECAAQPPPPNPDISTSHLHFRTKASALTVFRQWHPGYLRPNLSSVNACKVPTIREVSAQPWVSNSSILFFAVPGWKY